MPFALCTQISAGYSRKFWEIFIKKHDPHWSKPHLGKYHELSVNCKGTNIPGSDTDFQEVTEEGCSLRTESTIHVSLNQKD